MALALVAAGGPMKAHLEAQLRDKGYPPLVLGPFDGRAGEGEYTVTLTDARGRVLATERGTFDALRAWIARLPGRRPRQWRRRLPGRAARGG